MRPSHLLRPALRGPTPRPRPVTTLAGVSWPPSFIPQKKVPDAEDALVTALQRGDSAVVDGLLDDLLAASTTTTSPPRLSSSPWVVAHTRGTLVWRTFTLAGTGRRPALASQAINTSSGSVISRAEAWGGAILSTAVGTVAPRADDPATFDVFVTGASVTVGAGVDGAGVEKAGAGGRGRGPGWSVRLPIRGKGTFRVEYAGRRLRVFRGSGGLAVQVKPGVL